MGKYEEGNGLQEKRYNILVDCRDDFPGVPPRESKAT